MRRTAGEARDALAPRPRLRDAAQVKPAPFLFDLDGTLVDTLPDIAVSTNHVRAQHGLPALPFDVVRTFVGHGAFALLRRALAEVLPAGAGPTERFLAGAYATYVEHHRAQCTVAAKPWPGVREHLETLRERGHGLAVVTNKPEQFVRPLLAHVGLAELLPVVVGGDTLPQKKPDPEPLRHALRALGGPTDAGTMVGDGVPDLVAGKAAGLRTIGCLFGYGDPAELREQGADRWWRAFGVEAG